MNIALKHYNDWWRKKLCGDKQQWLLTESSLFCYHGQWQHAEPAPVLQYVVKSVNRCFWMCLTFCKWFNKKHYSRSYSNIQCFLVYSAQFFGLYVQWFFKKTIFLPLFQIFLSTVTKDENISYHKSTLKIILIVLRMSKPENVDVNYTLK